MSKGLKNLFLVHAVVGVVFGAAFLIKPGGFLLLFDWSPIDPLISRVLGAALLALAWSSYRGWQATERAQVATLLEMEAVFTVLAAVGLLRHLLFGKYLPFAWVICAMFIAFAIAWIVFLVKKPESA